VAGGLQNDCIPTLSHQSRDTELKKHQFGTFDGVSLYRVGYEALHP
jgi:hypothetical protein